MSRLPTLFIPHGGGPCFFMEWNPPDTWTKMAAYLRGLPEEIGGRPKAIVVISGHWEEDVVTVQNNPAPPLLYDYYGFPSVDVAGFWACRPPPAVLAFRNRATDARRWALGVATLPRRARVPPTPPRQLDRAHALGGAERTNPPPYGSRRKTYWPSRRTGTDGFVTAMMHRH